MFPQLQYRTGRMKLDIHGKGSFVRDLGLAIR